MEENRELSDLEVQARHNHVPIRRDNWDVLAHDAIVHINHDTYGDKRDKDRKDQKRRTTAYRS